MTIIFPVSVLCALILVGIFAISIILPSKRLWPPEQTSTHKFTWRFALIWIPATIGFAGIIIMGILDWNALLWPAWLRYGIGGTLFVLANIFLLRGVFQLGIEETSGMKGELVTSGLYRYSRNPQYVADIIMLASWGLLSASLYSIFVVGLGIICFVLMTFAEEPWLGAAYGDPYERYKKQTPRFLFF